MSRSSLNPSRRWLPPILLASALASLHAPEASAAGKAARAGAKDALARLVDLNRKALTDLKAGKAEAARDTLLAAMVAAKEANLGNHELMARTHVHLAATYLSGFNDRAKAIRQLQFAFKINPNITITPQLDSPKMQEVYQAARAQGRGAGGAAAPKATPLGHAPTVPTDSGAGQQPLVVGGGRQGMHPTEPEAVSEEEEPDPPAKVPEPLYCPLPDEVPPKEDIVVLCLTKQHTKKSSATVYYREAGAETFTALPMTRSKRGWLAATIPGSAVTGSAFQFYIEARVPGLGEPLITGSPENPALLPIVEGAPALGKGGMPALLKRRAEGAGAGGEGAEDSASVDKDPLEKIKQQQAMEEDLRRYHRRQAGALFVSMGAGSGYVLHGQVRLDSGSVDMLNNRSQLSVGKGSSQAKLGQVTPEIGYQVTDSLALSVQARYQRTPLDAEGWIPKQERGESTPPKSALAVFARAQYAFFTAGNFQTLASVVAGGGKHTFLGFVPRNCSQEAQLAGNCRSEQIAHSDTISGGPAAVGAGAGIMYHLARGFALFLEARAIGSLPRVMFLAEANIGLQVGYKFEKSAPAPVMTEGGWERPPESSSDSPSE